VGVGEVIAFITALCGLAGIIFTALRYNRESSTATVQQQSQIVQDMRTLNDELHQKIEDLKAEVKDLKARLQELDDRIR